MISELGMSLQMAFGVADDSFWLCGCPVSSVCLVTGLISSMVGLLDIMLSCILDM